MVNINFHAKYQVCSSKNALVIATSKNIQAVTGPEPGGVRGTEISLNLNLYVFNFSGLLTESIGLTGYYFRLQFMIIYYLYYL